MKKFFIITTACLLLVFYHLIPADAPSEDVWQWLLASVAASSLLYFLFASLETKK